jgi:two-component system LytT family sensor kinase
MKLPLKTIAFHLIGWLLFFSLVGAFMSYTPEFDYRFRFLPPEFMLLVVVYVPILYLNAHVLLPLFFKRKHVLYALCFLVLLLGVHLLSPFDHIIHRQGPPPGAPFSPEGPPRRGPVHLDIVSIVLFLCVWSVGMALQIMRQWRSTERRALQAEADKVSAELSFLKAQVNPHFLFNTLNNIYSLAVTKSEQTPEALLKLSRMLRYITDDVRNDFVPLKSEVDCVSNYIELQKLRLGPKTVVRFRVEGDMENKRIIPLVFMPFVENAFKYGISSHHDCVITVKIAADETGIRFFCQNQVMTRDHDADSTGIGLENVKKRLGHLYAGKHLLDIHTEDGLFTVHLFINA